MEWEQCRGHWGCGTIDKELYLQLNPPLPDSRGKGEQILFIIGLDFVSD